MVRHIVVGDANNRQIAMRSIGTLQDLGVASVAGYGMKTLLGEGMKIDRAQVE